MFRTSGLTWPVPSPGGERAGRLWLAMVANGPALVLTAAAAMVVWQLFLQRDFLHDDALISLRFARNFVEHGALEWNLGERVEGYTNFLHLMVTSGLMWLGFDPIVAVRIVNFAAAAGLGWGTWWLLGRLLPGQDNVWARTAGLALVLLSAPFVIWTMGGLETVMAAALLTAGIGLLVLAGGDTTGARPMLSGALIAASVLTRPDGVVAAGAAMAALLVVGPQPLLERVRLLASAGVALSALVLAHVAWRYGYYGELLPNTYYAKVGVPADIRLRSGVPYLLHALVHVPVLGMALVGFGIAAREKLLSPAMWMLAAAIVAHGAYVVWVGGDHMPAARLLLPVAALAAMLVALVVAALPAKAVRAAALVVCAAALAGSLATPREHRDSAAFLGELVGRHLAATEPAGTLVATTTAGSIPYYAPALRFIDTLGLVDHTIARRNPVPFYTKNQLIVGHSKGDGDYVMSRKPDIIIAGGATGADMNDPWFLTEVEVLRHPDFARCYQREDSGLAYSADYARLNPTHRNPMPYVIYRRQCPK